MNARGKPLTNFENFKAYFSEILSAKDTDFIKDKMDFEDAKISYQEYFSFKIDNTWTDLFWKFSLSRNKDISDCFMNFFTYIAQMCYFKDNSGKQAGDFKNDFSVFKQKENALFLFSVLDFFYKISIDKQNQVQIEYIDTCFASLFLEGKIDNTHKGQVRLFENGINLFTKCLEEGSGFENGNRIILFCMIQYAVKYNLTNVTDGLRHYIRVVRNLLQATRQRNETVYNTNVRINNFSYYWKLFKQLLTRTDVYDILLGNIDNAETKISDNALKNEKEKSEIIKTASKQSDIITALFLLEDAEPFMGLINQLQPKANYEKFSDYVKAINDFWELEGSKNLLILALIACDFKGFYTKNCGLGKMWFFGNKQWNTIFTGEGSKEQNENISKSILSLLDTYNSKKAGSITDKLQSIIDSKLKILTDENDKNWQYYFLKYPKMLKNGSYFSWRNDFEIETLGSEGWNPLVAYHINPYISVVTNMLDDKICEERDCYGRYSDVSRHILKNNVILYCKEEAWEIKPNSFVIDENIKQKYNITDKLLLKEPVDKDRIEIAIEFCKSLF
jgi:hypothetical protein